MKLGKVGCPLFSLFRPYFLVLNGTAVSTDLYYLKGVCKNTFAINGVGWMAIVASNTVLVVPLQQMIPLGIG